MTITKKRCIVHEGAGYLKVTPGRSMQNRIEEAHGDEQVRGATEGEGEQLRISNLLTEAVEGMKSTNQSSEHTDFEDDFADDSDSGQ